MTGCCVVSRVSLLAALGKSRPATTSDHSRHSRQKGEGKCSGTANSERCICLGTRCIVIWADSGRVSYAGMAEDPSTQQSFPTSFPAQPENHRRPFITFSARCTIFHPQPWCEIYFFTSSRHSFVPRLFPVAAIISSFPTVAVFT